MFKDETQGTHEVAPPKLKREKTVFNWKVYPVEDLIRFRDEITQQLPPLALKDMNLEEELLLQLHAVRALQNNVISDDTIALNQRAQVANSVASILNKLVELQATVWTQERFKSIEAALIRALRDAPEDVAAKFLDSYEVLVSSKGS